MVVPGGLGSPDKLRTDPAPVRFVRAFTDAGKPVGSSAMARGVFIETGMLAGRALACVAALRSDVTNAGAAWLDEAVHVEEGSLPLLAAAAITRRWRPSPARS